MALGWAERAGRWPAWQPGTGPAARLLNSLPTAARCTPVPSPTTSHAVHRHPRRPALTLTWCLKPSRRRRASSLRSCCSTRVSCACSSARGPAPLAFFRAALSSARSCGSFSSYRKAYRRLNCSSLYCPALSDSNRGSRTSLGTGGHSGGRDGYAPVAGWHGAAEAGQVQPKGSRASWPQAETPAMLQQLGLPGRPDPPASPGCAFYASNPLLPSFTQATVCRQILQKQAATAPFPPHRLPPCSVSRSTGTGRLLLISAGLCLPPRLKLPDAAA